MNSDSTARSRRWFALPCVILLMMGTTAARAATFPTGFVSSSVATGLDAPTAMAFAPDGRLFVCEQSGRLRVVKDDLLLTRPFLTLEVSSAGERGLLGIAFDPDFDVNQYIYVYYTVPSPTHNRISRFTADGDTALAGTELVLLDLNPLSTATNHNGGAIHFGSDGTLYAAVGENALGSNAQVLTNLLGKMIRINADGTIPTDNPWYADSSVLGTNKAIWALGLRNPFTFAFQPGSWRMFINDVGAATWEEVNDGMAGSNYGWPATEGSTSDPDFLSPVYTYDHGTGCAITGGVFYNPLSAQFPAFYTGKYFFADYCAGWISVLDPASRQATPFATGIGLPVDLQVSGDGSLYYLHRSPGEVAKVTFPRPMTVQLTSFDGAFIAGGTVQLDWSTLGEVDNDGFFVQRWVPDTAAWEILPNSFVDGSGTTSAPQQYSFMDTFASAGPTQYRLEQVDLSGAIYFTDPVVIEISTAIVEPVARRFSLGQNVPNPFNPATAIEFTVRTPGHASLTVYNSRGQRLETLFDGNARAGQVYTVLFDATGLASGVYFYRLQTPDHSETRKLVLLK